MFKALTAALALLPLFAHAETVRLYAAGSLAGTMGEMIAASGLAPGAVAPPVFGPAGLLRQRLEAGEPADLYLSADMAQPEHLAASGHAAPPVPFARNRLCLVAPRRLGLTPSGVLGAMLDPAQRLATSTPGSDPGGDYALAAFAKAEDIRRGARDTLTTKAIQAFGGPTAMVPSNGHTPGGAVLLADKADLLLYYCSGTAEVVKEVPDTDAIPLPPGLDPAPVYGMSVLGSNPDAARLALFILSPPGQAILARHGLLPVLPQPTMLTVAGGGEVAALSALDLNAVPALAMPVPQERGGSVEMRGPALWDVLQRAGIIDADFHKRLRQVITITGADGYTATLAMGEIDPEFEAKRVFLALVRDGAAQPLPRLVIPGDKRAGRGVRDVIRVDVR